MKITIYYSFYFLYFILVHAKKTIFAFGDISIFFSDFKWDSMTKIIIFNFGFFENTFLATIALILF